MSKQDFLNGLRMSLSGKMGSAQIEEHARYYEEYINAKVRMGETEENVLRELGNPRLIARTIIDAEGGEDVGGDREINFDQSAQSSVVKHKKFNLPLWLIVLLVVAAIFAVLGIVVAVLWWIAPVVIVVWLIVFLVKTLSGKK